MPPIDVDLSTAARYFDGSAASLIDALVDAERHHALHHEAIARARAAVRARYSEDAQLRELGQQLTTLLDADEVDSDAIGARGSRRYG